MHLFSEILYHKIFKITNFLKIGISIINVGLMFEFNIKNRMLIKKYK